MTTKTEQHEHLARVLAREIFKKGVFRGETPHRIQFMLGNYPDNEFVGCGLCEDALKHVIFDVLCKYTNEESEHDR